MLTYALSGTPARGAPVKVAAISSGMICEYNWTDLQFADGSKPAALPVTPASAELFHSGDRVRVKPHITGMRTLV